jgi:heme/copper-type cytochrome/quinol oxidase subunit 2
MLLQVEDENWLIYISRFMGGAGIFLLIAIILVIVVAYNRFFKNRR